MESEADGSDHRQHPPSVDIARERTSSDTIIDLTAAPERNEDDDSVVIVDTKSAERLPPDSPSDSSEKGEIPAEMSCFLCQQQMSQPSSTKYGDQQF